MGKNSVTYSRRDFLETFGKLTGAAAYLKWVAPLVPIIGESQSCKRPAAPEEPKMIFQYRTVEAIYTRNLDKIINPKSQVPPILQYTLYDADPRNEHLDDRGNDEWVQGGFRVGEKWTERISEDVYKCTLKNVFVQTVEFDEKHSCYLRDGKMWDGITRESSYTSDGLVIPGAVDISFCAAGYTMYFRMSD